MKIAIVFKVRKRFIAGLNDLFEESEDSKINLHSYRTGIFIILFSSALILSVIIIVISSLTVNSALPLIFLFLITIFIAAGFFYLKSKKDFDLVTGNFRQSYLFSFINLQKDNLLKKLTAIKNNIRKN